VTSPGERPRQGTRDVATAEHDGVCDNDVMRQGRALICVVVSACFADAPSVQTDVTSDTGSVESTATDFGDDSTSLDASTSVMTSTGPETATSTGPETTTSTGSDDQTDESGTTGMPEETMLVDLVDVLCSADIRSYEDPGCGADCSTQISCDTPSSAGHAYALEDADFEGTVFTVPTIEMAAYPSDTGLITAHFDGISLAAASQPRLRATAWCGPLPGCQAYWQVEIRGGGDQIGVASGIEVVDGVGAPIDIDLSAAVGTVVRVTLRMSNQGNHDPADRILFASPRVIDLE
jgi:hypothetical protein